MSRNGSGTYSAPSNSWNPAETGVTATVADWQVLLNDMVAAITQSVSKDGQTTMTNSLPMGGNKLTGLGAASGAGQSLRWEQMIKGDDIASADSISIPAEGSSFDVTGTTTITAIADTFIGKVAHLRFTDSLTITNSDSLVLPGGVNITTQPNDVAIFVNIAAGIWKCVTCAPITTQTIVGSDVSTPLNVVAYGSNSNGNWVRLAGGLQICWNTSHSFSSHGNFRVDGTWTFPSAFTGTPFVTGLVDLGSIFTASWPTDSSVSQYVLSFESPSGSTVTVHVNTPYTGVATGWGSVKSGLLAIGLWK